MTLVALAATAPACFWLWYFYRADVRREPITLIGATFVAGWFSVFPVYQLQLLVIPLLPAMTPDQALDKLLFSTTISAGLIEEMAKFAIVLVIYLTRREFDEPVDGLVYAVSAAMGFTMAEDLIKHQNGIDLWRVFSPPGHAMFAFFWGYALGQRLCRSGWRHVIVGLALSILVHGFWDALAICRLGESGRAWAPIAIFPLAAGLFWRLESKLRWMQNEGTNSGETPATTASDTGFYCSADLEVSNVNSKR